MTRSVVSSFCIFVFDGEVKKTEEKKMYENSGKTWTIEDVEKLREVYAHWNIEELEVHFKRPIKSIRVKVSKIKDINKRKKPKYTYNEVEKIFKDKGCILLSKEYVNNSTELKYICECKEERKIKLSNFLIGIRCKECGIKNRVNPNKRTQSEAENIFSNEGSVLLDTYINSKTPVSFLCRCNRIGIKTTDGFMKTSSCVACSYERKGIKFRHDIGTVGKLFSDGNCTLLDERYEDNRTPLKYKCECENISYIKLVNFLKGIRCEECTAKKRIKYNKDYIKGIVESNRCQYVSHERDCGQTRVVIICTCGREDSVYLPAFQLGAKCRTCAKESFREKMTGELHPNWKGGITEVHVWLRGRINNWRANSIQECNNRCVITGEEFNDVHHLYSFNLILQDVFDETGIPIRTGIDEYSQKELEMLSDACVQEHKKHPLGVCLKESIHIAFHNKYGYGNNTPEQFYEFKKAYKDDIFDEVL